MSTTIEIETGMEHSLDAQQGQFAAFIENDYDYKRLRRGEICEATILSVKESQVIVDLGARDGLQIYAPAITEQGVAGKVVDVMPNGAVVHKKEISDLA